MAGSFVDCSVRGNIATVTLNNPPLNVFKIEMTGELDRILENLRRDEAVRAILLTGAGRAFCAGSDISEFKDFFEPGQVVERKLRRQNAVFQKLDTFPKPVVAAIHGLAYGGGLEIAMCCDLIVAEEDCHFALPEMRLGVFPGSGGPYRTVRRIGPARTKQLIFLTEPIDAQIAFNWGLIDRVAPKGEASRAAEKLAAEMAKRPPKAFSLCKALIGDATRLSSAELISHSLYASDQVFASSDCRECARLLRQGGAEFRDEPRQAGIDAEFGHGLAVAERPARKAHGGSNIRKGQHDERHHHELRTDGSKAAEPDRQ